MNSGQLPTYYINGLFPEPVSTPYTLRVEVYADGHEASGSDGKTDGCKPSGLGSIPGVASNCDSSLPFEPPELFEFLEEFDSPNLAPIDLPTVRAAQLTEDEATAILAAAGWPAELIPQALAVAWCESKHSPGAIGDGGNSLGWFQLWTGWFYEGEDYFDALTNAKVALRVREVRGRWGGGGGWTCADLLGIP